MNENVKPCPFCGNTKLVITSCRELEECENFEECEDPRFWTICCDVHQGGCGASAGYYDTVEKAEINWNKRIFATKEQEDDD